MMDTPAYQWAYLPAAKTYLLYGTSIVDMIENAESHPVTHVDSKYSICVIEPSVSHNYWLVWSPANAHGEDVTCELPADMSLGDVQAFCVLHYMTNRG